MKSGNWIDWSCIINFNFCNQQTIDEFVQLIAVTPINYNVALAIT